MALPADGIQGCQLLPETVGTCYFATNSHAEQWHATLGNIDVAVKVIKVKYSVTEIKQELETVSREWQNLDHPNVARFYGLTMHPTNTSIPALVFHYYPDSNILEYVKDRSLSDEIKLTLIQRIAAGLEYLHTSDTVHGNIHERNIRMRGEEPVLIDYDQTSIIHDSQRSSSVNMPRAWRWQAPEVMKLSSAPPEENGDTISLFTKESDVYSFSMVIIAVFSEDLPFAQKRVFDVALCVADGNRPDFPPALRRYGRFTRLTERCWDGNPQWRPGMTSVCQELESDVLMSVGLVPSLLHALVYFGQSLDTLVNLTKDCFRLISGKPSQASQLPEIPAEPP